MLSSRSRHRDLQGAMIRVVEYLASVWSAEAAPARWTDAAFGEEMSERPRSSRRLRLVVGGPVGRAHSPPGLTVGTPAIGPDQAVADGPGPERRHPPHRRPPSGLSADRTRCPASSAFIRVQFGPHGRLVTRSLDDSFRARGYPGVIGAHRRSRLGGMWSGRGCKTGPDDDPLASLSLASRARKRTAAWMWFRPRNHGHPGP
jgi:hypothetical protein